MPWVKSVGRTSCGDGGMRLFLPRGEVAEEDVTLNAGFAASLSEGRRDLNPFYC